MDERIIRSVLDMLEQKESKLLSWGVTSGGFEESELNGLVQQHLDKNFNDDYIEASDVIKELEFQHLLFYLPAINTSGFVYRTRSAETIRLLDTLKQIIPFNRYNTHDINWRTAPNLVADYRYTLRPRLFPKRNVCYEEILALLTGKSYFDDLQKSVLEELLKNKDGEFIQLASFQVEAIPQMLESTTRATTSATIVTAGTGSGKTYCFYLPAFLHVSSKLSAVSYVQALAIYPRVELLKDQLTTAYKQTLKVNGVLLKAKGRSLSIGAYFGKTPYSKSDLLKELNHAKRDKWVCDFISCPDCGGDLVWMVHDINHDQHILRCQTCGHQTPNHGMLKLTREEIKKSPPDILFSITESLNRLIGDAWSNHIVGVGHVRPPELVLLDEVHTYSGIHGAQIANLLKRWKKAINNKPVHFTGLSATLENAEQFMADLCGLYAKNVVELKPREMVQNGMEYLLALRGDPVSGTALLSTSIQTLMLMRRVLETRKSVSTFYGKKVFAFTDDLDVNNRLYHNLLDAEGFSQSGNTFRRQFQPLAFYRNGSFDNEPAMYMDGQSWRISIDIGHRLEQPLNISRTSSQDSGVNNQADVVIATASLEVGYDDNEVGVVVQHKSPRDIASFLQRKGRAGRDTNMRPWTIITLSDYGRDRITYQSYEQLIEPVLPEKNLPIKNRYVLRIQAALTLLDWLAQRILQDTGRKVNIWRELTYKCTGDAEHLVLPLIRQLLKADEEGVYVEFCEYVKESLDLQKEEVSAIMWEQPRPVMLGLLPTIYRLLSNKEGLKKDPLPDFIPRALFSDLNLPEVEIIYDITSEDGSATMGIEQALKEFAPGRVSRRFGIESMRDSHWIPVSLQEQDQQRINIEAYFAEIEGIGNLTYRTADNQVKEIGCYRPSVIKVETLSSESLVKHTSNAFNDWRSYISVPSGEMQNELTLPEASSWNSIISKVECFSHQFGNPLTLNRFSIGSNANIKLSGGDELSTCVGFSIGHGDEVKPCALGYTLTVDGLCFEIKVPEGLTEKALENPHLLRGLKRSYFKHTFFADERLNGVANDFQKDWIHQAFVAAFVQIVATKDYDLKEAFECLLIEDISQKLKDVLKAVFSINENEEERVRVYDILEELVDEPLVIECLKDAAEVLWGVLDKDFVEWAKSCLIVTLGAGILETVYQTASNFDSSDVTLDIEDKTSSVISSKQKDDYDALIWISEKTTGGGGIIESFSHFVAKEPQEFLLLLESTFEASDFELADSQLRYFFRLLKDNDEPLIDQIKKVRSVENHQDLEVAHQNLHRTLQDRGILTVNTFYSALNVRVLRAGSSQLSDELLVYLMEEWETLEEKCGVEVDPRLFAYIASEKEEVRNYVSEVIDSGDEFGVIYSLLWPKGHILRANALNVYNPFQSFKPGDHLLVKPLLDWKQVSIDIPEWMNEVQYWLKEESKVLLTASRHNFCKLKEALFRVQAEPVDNGFLLLYPHLKGVSYENDKVVVKLILPENVY